MALAVEEILHLSSSLSGAGAAELFVAFRCGFHLQGYFFFFSIYLIIYFSYIWLHKATSITSHKWLSLSRCWKSHWDYIPPSEAAKGPLCLGTRFVPNAARQIYLFRIRPLSTAAAALCFLIILRKKGPRDVHTVRLCTYYHAEPVWWKCVPASFLFYNRVFSFGISDRGIVIIVARTL